MKTQADCDKYFFLQQSALTVDRSKNDLNVQIYECNLFMFSLPSVSAYALFKFFSLNQTKEQNLQHIFKCFISLFIRTI